MKKLATTSLIWSLVLQSVVPATVFANRVNDPDMPLDHCYHWLNERSARYLTYKYSYAAKNGGELTFMTTLGTTNGAAAGPGLYCAKTPVGSYSYGDRVIRIDLVDDVVMSNLAGQKVCGTNGRFYGNAAECVAKPVDILHYSDTSDWYVIQNPQAIKSWSATSDLLINDLNLGKQDDYSAGAHIDMTLAAMQIEIAASGKRTIMNSQARLGLEKILKDPLLIAKIPTLSLIDMIASYQGDKVSKKDRQDLIVTHFDKALKDKFLSYSDFDGLLKSHPTLKSVLASRLEAVNYGQLQNYNTAVMIPAIGSLAVTIDRGAAEKLWQNALVASGSLDSILGTKLRADGILRRAFTSALLPLAQLDAEVQDHNLVPMLNVLNEFADPKSNLKSYTETLFVRVLKSTTSVDFIKAYEGIKNSALAKEDALATLLSKGAKTKFANLDPIGTGLLYEKVKNQFNKQEQSDIEKDLLALPIKVDDVLSYQYLENYKYGKTKIPTFYPTETLLMKLALRSIEERSLGKNTTNTFRMYLSGFYFYFTKLIKDAEGKGKTPQDKAAAQDKAKDFFFRLSASMLSMRQTGYAYVALQNGLFFSGGLEAEDHPLEHGLGLLGQDAAVDRLIKEAVVTSLDPSVLVFLNRAEKAKGAEVAKAKALLDSVLSYMASDEVKKLLKDKDFIAAQAERKVWANIINNRHYGANGRVFSDICSLFTTYDKIKDELLAERKNVNTAGIEATKRLAQADFCPKDAKDKKP